MYWHVRTMGSVVLFISLKIQYSCGGYYAVQLGPCVRLPNSRDSENEELDSQGNGGIAMLSITMPNS